MSSVLHLTRHSAEAAADESALAAWRRAGAVGPANARPAEALPVVPAVVLERLIARGRVREGAPGTFYVFEARVDRPRVVTRLWFWLLVIGIPVVLHQILGRR